MNTAATKWKVCCRERHMLRREGVDPPGYNIPRSVWMATRFFIISGFTGGAPVACDDGATKGSASEWVKGELAAAFNGSSLCRLWLLSLNGVSRSCWRKADVSNDSQRRRRGAGGSDLTSERTQ